MPAFYDARSAASPRHLGPTPRRGQPPPLAWPTGPVQMPRWPANSAPEIDAPGLGRLAQRQSPPPGATVSAWKSGRRYCPISGEALGATAWAQPLQGLGATASAQAEALPHTHNGDTARRRRTTGNHIARP